MNFRLIVKQKKKDKNEDVTNKEIKGNWGESTTQR